MRLITDQSDSFAKMLQSYPSDKICLFTVFHLEYSNEFAEYYIMSFEFYVHFKFYV